MSCMTGSGVLWKLNYTVIYTSPYRVCGAVLAPRKDSMRRFHITIGGKSYGIGKSAFIATDGVNLAPVDSAIPDGIISDYYVGQSSTVCRGIPRLRQIWWTACVRGSTEPDRVLAFNMRTATSSRMTWPSCVFGSYTAGSTLTMDDIEDAWTTSSTPGTPGAPWAVVSAQAGRGP
jgi:hypothetical protein